MSHLSRIIPAIRSKEPLSLDRLRNVVPSAFAQEAHESRSSRYTFIPTSAVIDGLMAEGFQPYAAMQQRTRDESKRDYTRHVIRFRHPGAQPVNVGDSIPEIVLLNSHDGTSAYRLMAGLFRLVCSNGLVIAESTCADVSVRHSGNVVGEVIEGAFKVLDDTKTAIDASQRMAALTLSRPEQEVFAEAAAQLRWDNPEETPIRAEQLLSNRRYGDDGNDLWKTFNRVQENVIRGGLRGRTTTNRRMTTREVTGVSENIRLNRALWTLAEKMEALKAAA